MIQNKASAREFGETTVRNAEMRDSHLLGDGVKGVVTSSQSKHQAQAQAGRQPLGI